MAEINIGEEEKQVILEWAKNRPECRPHMHNLALLVNHYRKVVLPEEVMKCMKKQKARLTLFVDGHTDYEYRGCRKCKAKDCAASCGAADYGSIPTRKYSASDVSYTGNDLEEGVVQIELSPWAIEKVRELVEGKTYVVTGIYDEFKKRSGDIVKSISPTEDSPCGGEDV